MVRDRGDSHQSTPIDQPCTVNMRQGWTCTRGEHGDGPCALVPSAATGAITVSADESDGPVRSWDELRTSGALWLINSSAFHPRGAAIAICHDADGEPVGWMLVGQSAGSDEPWMFENTPDVHEKYRAINAEIAAVGGH